MVIETSSKRLTTTELLGTIERALPYFPLDTEGTSSHRSEVKGLNPTSVVSMNFDRFLEASLATLNRSQERQDTVARYQLIRLSESSDMDASFHVSAPTNLRGVRLRLHSRIARPAPIDIELGE